MKTRFCLGGVVMLIGFVLSGFSAVAEIGLNFTASTFGVDSSALPADTTGAIGPNHYVELLNGRFAVFDKNTGKSLISTPDVSFWTNAGVTLGRALTVTDPRVIYDPSSGRWFVSMVDLNIRRERANRFLLGISSSSDPTERWNALAIPATGTASYLADFPTMGVDTNGVYLSGDMFSLLGEPSGPVVLAIPKASVLADPPTTNGMFSSGVASYDTYGEILQPAVTTGIASSGEVLLAVGNLGLDFEPHSTLVLTPVERTNELFSLGTPVVLNVPGYEIPINPPQPGGIDSLDDGDSRISASVRRVGDILYAAHSTEFANRAAIRWYRIDPVGMKLIESGTIADPELDLIYPSIAANEAGTVVIGCNGTSSNTFISSFAYVGQTTNGVLIFGAKQLLKEGLDTYDTHDSEGTSRWGDYSATNVDPDDPRRFWTIQSYPTDSITWATQITQLVLNDEAPLLRLSIAGDGNSLRISWPDTPGAVLQFSENLTAPEWSDVSTAPGVSNGQASELVDASRISGFYRVIQR